MHDTLQRAVSRVLSPLVRLLLRHGVSHAEFADWSKQVYITEVTRSFGIEGRKPSVSRIAVVTGINRKEVKRVQELPSAVHTGVSKHNRAIRVVTGWLQDPEFQTDTGKPARLSFGNRNAPFNRLVRRYGGDVPARALLDELLRVGIVVDKKGQLELLRTGYVPQESEAAMLDVFATSASDLLTTLDSNLAGEQPGRLQMSVVYDNVTTEGAARFKRLCNDRAMGLLRELDSALSPYDREANPDCSGQGRVRTGLGVYYIEDQPANYCGGGDDES